MLYQITGSYFQDDHADSLRNDPVLNAVIGKTALASQPTLSRFHNRMDAQSLEQLEDIQRIFRRRVYSVENPEHTPLCMANFCTRLAPGIIPGGLSAR